MSDTSDDEVVYLHDKGDLILAVRDANGFNYRRFLVSSTALRLASRVFGPMFCPYLKERESGEPPVINLQDDDVDAMDFILSNAHFQADRLPNDFTAESIAYIAFQSNKYECHTVLAPWVRLWCDPERFPIDPHHKARDMSYSILVAWLFQSPNCQEMTAKYIKDLPTDFLTTSWKHHDILRCLPDTLRGKVESAMTIFLDKAVSNKTRIQTSLQQISPLRRPILRRGFFPRCPTFSCTHTLAWTRIPSRPLPITPRFNLLRPSESKGSFHPCVPSRHFRSTRP
jgi:hypothetical protein